MGDFCPEIFLEFVCIFMHPSDVIGGIPVVPSNFYPSLRPLAFEEVFLLYEKNLEVFIDAF